MSQTILTMSLLRFWALNILVKLLSMQGQKALGFHKNILIFVPKMNKGLMGLERHEVEVFHFFYWTLNNHV